MPGTPFPVSPVLTAIAVKYRNRKMIADLVAPRITVAAQAFKWWRYDLAEGFTLPDLKVGRRGQPSEIEFNAAEVTASTEDFGLDSPVPQADIDNAAGASLPDPRDRAVEGLMDLLALGREMRVASLVFNANTYAAANKTQLSGTSQWSDYTNSNPIDAMLQALDSMVVRANVAVLGGATWTKMRQHPKVVAAVYGNANTSGIITREQLAAVLEIDEVLVGEGFVNTAKRGQTASMGRAWGKHAALINRNLNGGGEQQGQPTFAWTADWGGPQAGSERDSKIGVRGGERVRAYESVKEVVSASDLGYFFQDAVA